MIEGAETWSTQDPHPGAVSWRNITIAMGPLKSEGSETHIGLPHPGEPTPGRGTPYHLILKSSAIYILERLRL